MSNESETTKRSHDLDRRKTQWHMAVTPAMKLELMEYSQILHYDTGYLLNTNALEIDLLIIKKADDTVIENEIGRIFRRHNIIEYKSPHDREGINTFFKVNAYASLYKMGEGNCTYEPEEITITMIRQGKPYKLFKWFMRHGCSVDKVYEGVYYIRNAGFFQTQVIVAKELDEADHIWIRSLTDKMDRHQAEHLIHKSRELMGRPEAGYVDAVLQIASKANRKIFDEVKKEDRDMYQAFVDLMQPEIDEAVNKRLDEAVSEAVSKAVSKALSEAEIEITARNKVEAIDNAMKKLNMSEEDACRLMDTTVEEYDTYRKIAQNASSKNKKRRKTALR